MEKEDYKMIDVNDIFEEAMKASKPKKSKYRSIYLQRKMREREIQKWFLNTTHGKQMVSNKKED